VGVGERDRERKAGEAGTRAEVGDPCCPGELRDGEAGQAVGDVDVDGSVGLGDGRVGIGCGGERREQRDEPVGRFKREGVCTRERGQARARFTGNGQRSPRSTGVTTSRRSGSSPSLWVATSVRSLR
jgi:hypothetical protein